jgi:Ca-activated chloride channel family protein
VADVYPQRIPDLFSAKPVIMTGRYTSAGSGVVRLKGKMSGRDFVRDIPVTFPESKTQHDVLAPLWARSRIDDLMSQDLEGMQQGSTRTDLKETITNLGLEYRLMTQFTSFVAVEEMIVTDGGTPRRVDVPVEVPEGVSREGVFGEKDQQGYVGTFATASPSVGRLAMTETLRVASSGSGSRAKPERGGGGGGGRGLNKGASSGNAKSATVAVMDEAAARQLSPEEEKQQLLLTKFHPTVLAVIERLKTKATPSANEAKFIRGDKAEIQIWLNDKSPEVMTKLKELGFEVVLDPKSARLVIGRLPIEKLQKLAELKFVRYVAPQLSS